MFSLLKSSFGDVVYIYKNLGHWLISKILITLSRYGLAFLFILPLLVILITIVWVSPYSFFEYEKIVQDILIASYPLGNNFLGFNIWSILISIVFILMVLGGIISMFYNRMLLAKINIQYIQRKNLKYKKNLYLDRKMFFKYIKLSLYIVLILFTPVILFIVGFIILFLFFGGSSGVNTLLSNSSSVNVFSLISFAYLIVCLFLFLYLLFRLYFSYFVLVESNKKTVIQCIKKSFTITKGYNKILKFLGIMGILFLLYLPFNYVSQVIDYNSKSVSYYVGMKNYVGNDSANEKLSAEEFYAFSELQQNFDQFSDEELVGKVHFMNILSWIYFLFHFVFLYGIFDMMLVSFYKRELLNK